MHSQGALVARKAFRHIEEDIREKRILSLTVWGDPYELFREEFADKFPANLPEKVSYIAECEMNKKPRTQAPAVEDGRSAEQQRPQGSFAQQVAWAVGLSPAVPDNPLLPEDPPDLLCARTDEGFPDVGTLFESTRKWIDWVKQQLMGVVVKFNIAHPYLAFVAFPKLLARLLFEAPFQFHLLALAIAQRDKTKISRWLLNPAHFFYGIDGKTRHSAISNLDAYLRFDLPAAS